MEKIIKYAVVNILQDTVKNDKFTYYDYFHDYYHGTYKRWDTEQEATASAKRMYDKEPHTKGQYHNWAVLKQTCAKRKRIEHKILKQEIVFCANPNFVFANIN